MKSAIFALKNLKNDRGVSAVIVGIMMLMFLGFAALAIDFGHLYVVRNELQNAADAGALAAARVLYLEEDGALLNEDANQSGFDAATENKSEKISVDVNWTADNDNEGDVQRGHWRFSTGDNACPRGFTPNADIAPPDLQRSTEELDADCGFINAVRVITRRQATPAASFFARIFGHENFSLSAAAVAYIGFAGTLEPGVADQPIAICKESLLDEDGTFTCGVGRMINSGATDGHQTGGWTNFSQPCETASTPTVRPLVCGDGNPNIINLGQGMGTVGGELQSTYNDLYACWKNSGMDTDEDGWPDKPWRLTFPVIECPGNNTSNCSTVVGAVELDIIWITQTDKNQFNEVPRKMDNWTCPSGSSGPDCWTGFVDQFELRDVLNNTPAFYEDKTIYFKPNCSPHIPAGRTGGENFGILAKIPVLVK